MQTTRRYWARVSGPHARVKSIAIEQIGNNTPAAETADHAETVKATRDDYRWDTGLHQMCSRVIVGVIFLPIGAPRTGVGHQPVGTAPLRQAAGATSWPPTRHEHGKAWR